MDSKKIRLLCALLVIFLGFLVIFVRDLDLRSGLILFGPISLLVLGITLARHELVKDILRGSITAVASVLPAAIIVGILYKFPVFMVGDVSGFGILTVLTDFPIWMLLYGILVASPFMIIGGIISSLVIRRIVTDQTKRKKYIYIGGITVSFAGAFFLAILDKIIGPW